MMKKRRRLNMQIQTLELRTGLERPTIRFYEREGLISPQRRNNGYREYSEEDVEQLLKIKLLRQLGMSLEQVRCLQQGSEDFSLALAQQVEVLSRQIQENKRAKTVCQIIYDDQVDYKTMDAAHYLRLLRELPAEGRLYVPESFQEKIPEEIHPWKRFVARILDYALWGGLMTFLLYVILRLRPLQGNFTRTLLTIGCGFMFVPIEALMLHIWGTTPGKWAMGISLEAVQGGNLCYRAALRRSWQVFSSGMGFSIPYLRIMCNVHKYCVLTGRSMTHFARYNEINPPEEMYWDEETEILYRPARWIGITALIAAYVTLVSMTAMDMVKPKYRGNELTIAQFAENYNDTIELLDREYERLNPDGTAVLPEVEEYVVYFGGEPEKKHVEFSYETENGILRSVTYENKWTDVFYFDPMEIGEPYIAAVSLLLAQDGCGLRQWIEFNDVWQRLNYENISNEISKILTDQFVFQNLEVYCELTMENCSKYGTAIVAIDQDIPAAIALRIQINLEEN